jgi:hypothetical protein
MHNNSYLEINAKTYRDRMEEKAGRERLRRLAAWKDETVSPRPEPTPVQHSSILVRIGKIINWPVRMLKKAAFLMHPGH